MSWILSPLGIGAIAVLVIVIASLIYWQRKPIKRWLRRQTVDEIELGAGPVKVKLKGKKEPEASSASAGVDFGEGSDFTGATIRGVAGRDIRRGSAAAESPGGKAPGVDFGKKGKFGDAEIEDVAGRDIVED
jgi:hypothetical protein